MVLTKLLGCKFGDGKGAASVPPLPSFAHIALPFGGKIPPGTSTVDFNSGIVLEKLGSATHAGGFSSMFFLILFRYVHVLMDHGMITCIVVNDPNSGVEWHSTRQKCARRRRFRQRWTSQICSLPVNCYAVYLEADVLLLQIVSCWVESRRWKLVHVTRSCVNKNCYGGWKGKVYEGCIVVSRSISVLYKTLY